MTITVPAPAVTPEAVELTHVVCCDDDVALCGMDVSGFTWCGDDEPITCALCAILDEDETPCPKCPGYGD